MHFLRLRGRGGRHGSGNLLGLGCGRGSGHRRGGVVTGTGGNEKGGAAGKDQEECGFHKMWFV